jgi:hypothetical protein
MNALSEAELDRLLRLGVEADLNVKAGKARQALRHLDKMLDTMHDFHRVNAPLAAAIDALIDYRNAVTDKHERSQQRAVRS